MQRLKEIYKTFSDKRFSTIAGTLVYFLLMSVAPFIFWLTLVFGKENVDVILANELVRDVSPFLRSLKNSAESAVGGAGIIFLVTTLYSSTNFFYHLRRSGEIIYDSPRVKGGIKLRLASLFLIIISLISFAAIALFSVFGSWFLEKFMPPFVAEIISVAFSVFAAFVIALVLNLFACPYKLKLSEAVSGSLLTCAIWIILLIGFSVYLRFANPEKLYGKIASLIIFLLWCYVMMSSFVIGVIYNGTFKTGREYKTLL